MRQKNMSTRKFMDKKVVIKKNFGLKKTGMVSKLKTQTVTNFNSCQKFGMSLYVKPAWHLDIDDMYSGQRFAILQYFFCLVF